jgi:TPR repeat protein
MTTGQATYPVTANQPKDAAAMYELGARLHKRGKDGAAEEWFRKAAAAGHAKAMSAVGFMAAREGKNGEAVQWLRKAVAAGDAAAAYNLAVIMHNQGKGGEAEQWLRKAAAAQRQGWFKGMNYWSWERRGWEWSRSGGNKKIAEMGKRQQTRWTICIHRIQGREFVSYHFGVKASGCSANCRGRVSVERSSPGLPAWLAGLRGHQELAQENGP